MLRRALLTSLPLLPASLSASAAMEKLRIDATTGRIDFTVGESVFFRTSGIFQSWQGVLGIDLADIPSSQVQVTIDTGSVDTRDAAQDAQLRGPDFFDVTRCPAMSFVSRRVERIGARGLRITGDLTLRGIVGPMVLAVDVAHEGLRPGRVAAQFTASGQIKRSQFGMMKYVDITGDTVDIRIRADAVR